MPLDNKCKANANPPSKAPRRPFSLSTFLTDFISAAYDLHFHDEDEDGYASFAGDDDDWSTSPMPGGDAGDLYDELVDFGAGMLESVLIATLALAFVGLLLYRRRRAEERDAAARGAQVLVQPVEGGVFPNPAEPEFRDWVAGGVAH